MLKRRGAVSRPMSLTQGLVSEFRGLGCWEASIPWRSWLLLPPAHYPHHWAQSVHQEPPADGKGGGVYLLDVCVYIAGYKDVASSPGAYTRAGVLFAAPRTSSCLATVLGSHSLITQRGLAALRARATSLFASVISPNKRAGNTLQQSSLLLHPQNNVSGDELEADLTYILNKRSKVLQLKTCLSVS